MRNNQGLVKTSYTVAQGTRIGRMGRVSMWADANGVAWVGGQVHILIEGHVKI